MTTPGPNRQDSRAQIGLDIVPTGIAITAIITLLVGASVYGAATSGRDAYTESSEEWCEEHGGDLHVVHSFAHGGLHCELPNGTTVHVPDVAKNESEVQITDE